MAEGLQNQKSLLRPLDALAGAFMAALLLLALAAWARGVPRARDAVAHLSLGIALLFALRGSVLLVKDRKSVV